MASPSPIGTQSPSSSAAASWPFPAIRRIGSTVYIGLQVLLPKASHNAEDIEPQTHHVFNALQAALEYEGGGMGDLTKLHTYYLFDGEGRAVTDYWERMTAARLQHLADPGPAATALRVQGLWAEGVRIGADGIGELSGDKARIMPKHAWDWSIPTPFSQGWRVDDKVYVGGQISSDRAGRTIAADRAVEQTANTMEYIRHVLLDAKANWEHVTLIKIAHKWTDDEQASRQVASQILREVQSVFPDDKPALVMLGVDLLYEGLMLEIDAVAVNSGSGTPVRPAESDTWAAESANFPPARRTAKEIYIGGQSAPTLTGMRTQLDESLRRTATILAQAGGSVRDLVKVNVYYRAAPGASVAQADVQAVIDTLARFLAPGRTVVSLVRVAGFMTPGQLIQIDGLAVLGAP